MYSTVNLLVPSACALIVLSVIVLVAFFVLCKKRPGFEDPSSNGHHSDQMCTVMRDDPYLLRSLSSACDTNTTGRGGGILSILDQRKESSCLSEMTETPSKIYVSSRYAMNHLQQHYQQIQQQQEHDHEELVDACETTAKQHHLQYREAQQIQQQLEQQGLSLRVMERDDPGNLVQSGQPIAFRRVAGAAGMDHHTYDVPLPAKWV